MFPVRVSLAILGICVTSAFAQGPTCWVVDTGRSSLIVHVRPAGLFSGQLHAHSFVPTDWQGRVCFHPEKLGSLELELTVQADSLEDRQPELSREDIQKVERQVAGPEVLDSASYPQIRYAADQLTLDSRNVEPSTTSKTGSVTGTLRGELSLHGQTRPLDVPVTARWAEGRLRAAGSAELKQSDFGIEPYSRFLGTVSVEDRVTIEFSIDAVPDKS